MNPTWLTTGAAELPSAVLRELAVESFGMLAQQPNLAELLRTACLPTDATCLAEWRRAIAEEILLAKLLRISVPQSALQPYLDVPPFDTSTRPLKDLLGRRAAVAMIPLDGGDKPPFCAHLWLVEDASAPQGALVGWQSLPAGCECRGSRFAVHAVCSRRSENDIAGESYQLALRLAQRAVIDQHGPAIEALAIRWITSGKVNDPHVERVQIGNKLELASPRKWLLPKANKREVRDLERRLNFKIDDDYAADLDTAWNIITGTGPLFEGEMSWPVDVDVLHSFVSGAREPLVAAALLTRPRKVILWHSGGSWLAAAHDLTRILVALLPSVRVNMHPISSSNLVDAQRVLKSHPVSVPEQTVLFNITQGNRLMSFAAQNVAQSDPNIWLVYRDLDADPFEFTMIRYEHDHVPHTYVLDGTERAAAFPRIKWHELFKRQAPRLPEPWQDFVARVRRQPCQKCGKSSV